MHACHVRRSGMRDAEASVTAASQKDGAGLELRPWRRFDQNADIMAHAISLWFAVGLAHGFDFDVKKLGATCLHRLDCCRLHNPLTRARITVCRKVPDRRLPAS